MIAMPMTEHAHHGHRPHQHGPVHAHAHGSGHRPDEPHDHRGHRHDHGMTAEGRLLGALGLTASFMVVEAVTGWLVHSLALVSDAGHMLADAGALALAVMAQRVATRPRTILRTYGYRRAETLAALANGIVLGVTALWVIVEAVSRWREPAEIRGTPMLVVAACGLVVNLASAWLLSSGSGHGHNTNTRAALAHVASDALGLGCRHRGRAARLVVRMGPRRYGRQLAHFAPDFVGRISAWSPKRSTCSWRAPHPGCPSMRSSEPSAKPPVSPICTISTPGPFRMASMRLQCTSCSTVLRTGQTLLAT